MNRYFFSGDEVGRAFGDGRAATAWVLVEDNGFGGEYQLRGAFTSQALAQAAMKRAAAELVAQGYQPSFHVMETALTSE